MSKTVAEMTSEELKEMLEELIEAKLVDLLGDPDEGEELREGLIERLKLQRSAVEHGERGESSEEVARHTTGCALPDDNLREIVGDPSSKPDF